jgi:hypothetical protein
MVIGMVLEQNRASPSKNYSNRDSRMVTHDSTPTTGLPRAFIMGDHKKWYIHSDIISLIRIRFQSSSNHTSSIAFNPIPSCIILLQLTLSPRRLILKLQTNTINTVPLVCGSFISLSLKDMSIPTLVSHPQS